MVRTQSPVSGVPLVILQSANVTETRFLLSYQCHTQALTCGYPTKSRLMGQIWANRISWAGTQRTAACWRGTRRRRPERCASLLLGHLGRDLVDDVEHRGVGGVDGQHRNVDGHVVAHGQRTLTGKSASAHLSVGGARLNRQSLSGILALSSDITAPVPLTSIPVVPIAVLISAGVSSSRSRTYVATGGGAPLLQEATKMHALASASTTVSCRMFISPTPRPARGACGAAESGMCTVEYPRGAPLPPLP